MNIDGKLTAKKLREQLAVEVSALKLSHGLAPSLTVIVVGDDPASQIYVKNKVKQTQEVGMISNEIKLPATTSELELLEQLEQLNNDNSVHGVLVQLPLPKHIDESVIISAINPNKDVDGFHALNSGRLFNGEPGALVPCTPQGCIILAKQHLGNDLCQQADILVAAVGIAKFVKAEWVKEGATVIDVGINRIINHEGKVRLVGDVDYDEVVDKCGAITPVPGGVGPMTIACLLKNTLIAAKHSMEN